jgi:hypothetical protein
MQACTCTHGLEKIFVHRHVSPYFTFLFLFARSLGVMDEAQGDCKVNVNAAFDGLSGATVVLVFISIRTLDTSVYRVPELTWTAMHMHMMVCKPRFLTREYAHAIRVLAPFSIPGAADGGGVCELTCATRCIIVRFSVGTHLFHLPQAVRAHALSFTDTREHGRFSQTSRDSQQLCQIPSSMPHLVDLTRLGVPSFWSPSLLRMCPHTFRFTLTNLFNDSATLVTNLGRALGMRSSVRRLEACARAQPPNPSNVKPSRDNVPATSTRGNIAAIAAGGSVRPSVQNLYISLRRISHAVLQQFTQLESVRGLLTTVDAWRTLYLMNSLTHLECGNIDREHTDFLPPSLICLRTDIKFDGWLSSEWNRVLKLPLLTQLHVPRGFMDNTTLSLATRLTHLSVNVRDVTSPQEDGASRPPSPSLTFTRLQSLRCNLYPLSIHRFPVLRVLHVTNDRQQMSRPRCDSIVDVLRDIPTLTELRLSHNICNTSLEKLCAVDGHSFRTLRVLTVGTSTTETDFRCLSVCSVLETLAIQYYYIPTRPAAIPAHLPAIPTLQHLRMTSWANDSSWITALPALYPNLQTYWIPSRTKIRQHPNITQPPE